MSEASLKYGDQHSDVAGNFKATCTTEEYAYNSDKADNPTYMRCNMLRKRDLNERTWTNMCVALQQVHLLTCQIEHITTLRDKLQYLPHSYH